MLKIEIFARQPHLTENISSWIELVVFHFLILILLVFLGKFLRRSPLCLGANVDLSFIVKRLLMDLRGCRCDWFRDNVFDFLVVQFTSQSPGTHLGVWDGCGQEEESYWTGGTSITSGKYNILPGFRCICFLLSCILQLLFLFLAVTYQFIGSIHDFSVA